MAQHGGWAENDRQDLPRRQNPHMHLFEACLALYETTGEARHIARAGEIFGLLRTRFIEPESGLLTEFFGPAWEHDPAFGSQRLDPGHMMEWTWLLRRYERVTGQPVAGICRALFDNAQRLGLRDGFLADEVDASGRALIDRRRLWPQTEYLKALIVQATATGDPKLLDRAADLLDRMHATYLSDVPRGAWCDQFDLAGRPTAENIPASILYHAFAPAVEILRL